MLPKELTQDIKNYKKIGYDASMNVVRQEEEDILLRKKVLAVLAVIEDLTDMLNNKEFTKARSAYICVYTDEFADLTLLVNELNSEKPIECDKTVPEYKELKSIFENASAYTGYFEGAFNLTLSGIEELKKEWLGEEVCVALEKDCLEQEVKAVPREENKTPKKQKI